MSTFFHEQFLNKPFRLGCLQEFFLVTVQTAVKFIGYLSHSLSSRKHTLFKTGNQQM